MKNGYFLLMTCVVLIGAGCGSDISENAPVKKGGLPKLEITSPVNAFKTSSTLVYIEGRASTKEVFINETLHTIDGKPFKIPVEIHSGLNTITIHAGTGYTTTTVIRLIERL